MNLINNPKVSVVLPVYNGERYLAKSIESVLNQVYPNFEFIIWDDGSGDGTYGIASAYSDPRIRLFKSPVNQGIFKTINLAINKAEGTFIHLWSSDDIMNPDCLTQQVNFHLQHPLVAMSYCARDTIDANGVVVITAAKDDTPDIINPALAAQIMFFYGSIAGNISTAMMKKDIVYEVGLFNEGMQQSADFLMWVAISKKYPIGFIRTPLMCLRKHKNQFSRLKGMGVVFMKEDRVVVEELMRRLPIELLGYARAYNRWHRYVVYVQYMMRCLASGQFKTAYEAFKLISSMDNIFVLMFLWFISCGGHLVKKCPRYINV